MAITLTVEDLRDALRLGTTDEETSQVTRLLGYATAAIENYVETAPDPIHNEAAIRLAGYLFDQPFASRGRADYSNAFRFSGAANILAPHRRRQLGLSADSDLPATDLSGGSIDLDAINALIAAAIAPVDQLATQDHEDILALATLVERNRAAIANLPSGGGGGLSTQEVNTLIAAVSDPIAARVTTNETDIDANETAISDLIPDHAFADQRFLFGRANSLGFETLYTLPDPSEGTDNHVLTVIDADRRIVGYRAVPSAKFDDTELPQLIGIRNTGTSDNVSRADHVHDLLVNPASALFFDNARRLQAHLATKAEFNTGTATDRLLTAANKPHIEELIKAANLSVSDDDPLKIADTASEGSADTASRSDHVHALTLLGTGALSFDNMDRLTIQTATKANFDTGTASNRVLTAANKPHIEDLFHSLNASAVIDPAYLVSGQSSYAFNVTFTKDAFTGAGTSKVGLEIAGVKVEVNSASETYTYSFEFGATDARNISQNNPIGTVVRARITIAGNGFSTHIALPVLATAPMSANGGGGGGGETRTLYGVYNRAGRDPANIPSSIANPMRTALSSGDLAYIEVVHTYRSAFRSDYVQSSRCKIETAFVAGTRQRYRFWYAVGEASARDFNAYYLDVSDSDIAFRDFDVESRSTNNEWKLYGIS